MDGGRECGNIKTLTCAAGRFKVHDHQLSLRAKAAASSPAGAIRKIGLPDCGNSLALEQEVKAMRHLPITITPELKRTRTSWSLTLRVQFKSL
jgi:hypothetical protein